MLKTAITAVATAIVCFSIMAATGLSAHLRTQTFLTARVGDSITIPAIDLFCHVFNHDLNNQDPGAAMYCDRNSNRNVSIYTASVLATSYHFHLGRSGSHIFGDVVSRAP